MTEARINRILQFFYPTLVFLTLVLSWNTVGQARGFGDSKIADFNFEPQKNQPTAMQLSCSQDGSDFKSNETCKSDTGTPWMLLNTDEGTLRSSKKKSYFTSDPDSKNAVSQDNRSSWERESL